MGDILSRAIVQKNKYKLKISSVSQALTSTIQTQDVDEKILYAVKTAKYRKNLGATYIDKLANYLPLGYLFGESAYGATGKIYYSPGNANNMTEIGLFDGTLESNVPKWWIPAIGEAGEIIWVYGKDSVVRASIYKPRVHVAGTYSTAPELTMSDGINPISWLPSGGIDFARDAEHNEYCMFAEYTGKSQGGGNLYVWKVTKPYNIDTNWTKVLTKAQSTDAYGTTGDIWHFHSCQHDPYSDTWLVTSGDGDALIHVWISVDRGVTWTEVAGGSQIYRTLNYIFTEDYVYWAADKASDAHALYQIGRDVNGVPDFSTITKLVDLPSWQATYVTVLMHSPSGLLMLDRVDTDALATANPILEVYFWSFDDRQLYNVANLTPLEANKAFGFRCKSATLVQGTQDSRVIVGFGEYVNGINLLTNDNYRHGTLTLEIV